MPKNKIKSFTLPELLVVMIITAIIVGLAFGTKTNLYHSDKL
jgi:prepilin-type N-terminal cleavage/methylation domain-containing protein